MLAPRRAAAKAAPHGPYGPPSPFGANGALCIWIRGSSQIRIVSAVLCIGPCHRYGDTYMPARRAVLAILRPQLTIVQESSARHALQQQLVLKMIRTALSVPAAGIGFKITVQASPRKKTWPLN